jgi:hypothetical protein
MGAGDGFLICTDVGALPPAAGLSPDKFRPRGEPQQMLAASSYSPGKTDKSQSSCASAHLAAETMPPLSSLHDAPCLVQT